MTISCLRSGLALALVVALAMPAWADEPAGGTLGLAPLPPPQSLVARDSKLWSPGRTIVAQRVVPVGRPEHSAKVDPLTGMVESSGQALADQSRQLQAISPLRRRSRSQGVTCCLPQLQ